MGPTWTTRSGLLVEYCCVLSVLVRVVTGLELTLIHTNDVHSRFRQANARGGFCSEVEEANENCYGGFPRLYHKAEEIRRSHRNVIYLSGGDYFQGTVWYTLYKWEVVAKFVNQLHHTAMALGNHEFDDGVSGLLPFLNNVTFPILSANIDTSEEPSLKGKIKKSVTVVYEDQRVGIIGYTTEETMWISNPGKNLFFGNVTAAVEEEAKRLHDQGVKIIFAVGHAGYEVDMEVAKVPYVDVVVGGHTNTFLYNGTAPHDEIPEDKYPTIVRKKDGTEVPVVQAFAHGKYLGYLNLTFDLEGNLIRWRGNPILLDHTVPQDPKMLEEIDDWNNRVNRKTKVEVGRTRVLLDGERMSCRKGECNLGNLVADAQVFHYLKFADDDNWADVTLGIVHSGSIRLSISERRKNGSITMEDILAIQPFGHAVDVMMIRGKHLREIFEFSVTGFDPDYFDPSGKFLQVSGIRIVYDITRGDGSRVRSIHVLCKECRIPQYVPLEDEKIYKVTVPGFLVNGGSGYDLMKRYVIDHFTAGIMDADVLIEYFTKNNPVTQGIEGRISFETEAGRRAHCFQSGFGLVKGTPIPLLLQKDQEITAAPGGLNETEEVKKDQIKAEEIKQEVKEDEVKPEEVKAEEIKQEVREDEVKPEEVKTDEIKPEEVEVKVDELDTDQFQTDKDSELESLETTEDKIITDILEEVTPASSR